jgi:hypothetical protein
LLRPIRFRAQTLRSGIVERSRERGLPFDSDYFTVDRLMSWLANDPRCECCNCTLDVGFKFDRVVRDASPSLDRMVPELGYVKGNVSLICWRCNRIKGIATADDLERVAVWMRSKLQPIARAA